MVAAVVCHSKGGSIPSSSRCFSGHMVGHMALAGLRAWMIGDKLWMSKGELQTAPLMAFSSPTLSQESILT